MYICSILSFSYIGCGKYYRHVHSKTLPFRVVHRISCNASYILTSTTHHVPILSILGVYKALIQNLTKRFNSNNNNSSLSPRILGENIKEKKREEQLFFEWSVLSYG